LLTRHRLAISRNDSHPEHQPELRASISRRPITLPCFSRPTAISRQAVIGEV
jgi:hypothetical protein